VRDDVAVLFPGQGVDLAPALSAWLPKCSELLECAGSAVGGDAARLLERGGRQLWLTQIAQPVLLALSLEVSKELASRGVGGEVAAGHSLGELAAWSALGGVEATAAIELAAERGRVMAREAERHPGGMVALVDVDEATVEDALRWGQQRAGLTVAARNAPDEWVLSGDEPALSAVLSRFRSVRLRTQGAWHSPAMEGAVDDVLAAFKALPRRALSGRLVANRTGDVVAFDSEIPELLAEQLVRPIQWMACLRTLHERGARRFVTIGPGKVLRGHVRKTLGHGVRVLSTETPSDLDQTVQELKS
jgi:[acyl-carrier-protein] S-malonyltransferase